LDEQTARHQAIATASLEHHCAWHFSSAQEPPSLTPSTRRHGQAAAAAAATASRKREAATDSPLPPPCKCGSGGLCPRRALPEELLGPRLWGRQRASAVRVARASAVTQPLSPTLPSAFALPLAAGRAVRLRATIRADPAVLFQTSGLPGRALLLRLRWTAVTFSIRTTTGTVLSEQDCRRGAKQ